MVVWRLKNGRARGATEMQAKHHKGWLNKIQHEEKAVRENSGREGADPGLGRKWRIFIELIQTIWERGEISEQVSWMVVVLLPKDGGDFWQHIAKYIVDKPIFRTCLNGVRRRGSSVRQFWWVQPMDLETTWVARLVRPVVVSDDEGD